MVRFSTHNHITHERRPRTRLGGITPAEPG